MKAANYLLKCARYAMGMSKKDAAEACGVSYETYNRAEMGQNIRPSSWRKMVKYFDLDKHLGYDESVAEANTSTLGAKTSPRG